MHIDEGSVTVVITTADKQYTCDIPQALNIEADFKLNYKEHNYNDMIVRSRVQSAVMTFAMTPLSDENYQYGTVTMKRTDNYEI